MARPAVNAVAELLRYDAESGQLVWKVKRNGRNGGVAPGDIAGGVGANGYVRVGVLRKSILAHVIVWALATGEWPTKEVDHRNCNKSDNRLDNLRLVSHRENAQNLRRAAAHNKSSGLLGVTQHRPGRFSAYLHEGGRKLHLGTFASGQEAHEAHVAARRQNYPGNTL